MIEQIMYFLLGVLLATLVALLVLPAVWHRAVRLTTKRVEAAVPISLFEVQAEKDQQRAFFALNQRRIELQADEMRATVTAQAASIETQRQRIHTLEAQISALTQGNDKAAAQAAEQLVLKGELQDQVSLLKSRIADLEKELDEAQAGVARLEGENGALGTREKTLTQTLAERDARIAEQDERGAALQAEVALLSTTLTTTTQRLDDTADLLAKAQADVTRLEAALAAETAHLAETEAARAERTQAAENLTAERDGLSAALSTAQEDLEASRAVLHALEQRRANEFVEAETQARRISSERDRLRADHMLMADALEKARRSAGAGTPEDITPVREALADVAARVVALTARLEGSSSPLPGLLAQRGGSSLGADSGAPSLADRIRVLLAEADGTENTERPASANGSGSDQPAETPPADDETEDPQVDGADAADFPQPAARVQAAP